MVEKLKIYDILEEISSADTFVGTQNFRLLLAQLASEFLSNDIYLSSKLFKELLELVQDPNIDVPDGIVYSLAQRVASSDDGHKRFRFWVHVWSILVTDPDNVDTDELEENFRLAKEAVVSFTTVSDKAVRKLAWANRSKYRRGAYGGSFSGAAKNYDRAKKSYDAASAKAMAERSRLLGCIEGLRKNLSQKMAYQVEYGSRTQRLHNEASTLRGAIVLLVALALGLLLYLRWTYFAYE